MTRKSTHLRTPDTIIIPELEEAMARFQPHKHSWSDTEIATLKKYYGRVPITLLESTLHRKSTKIHEKVVELGGTRGDPFEGEA